VTFEVSTRRKKGFIAADGKKTFFNKKNILKNRGPNLSFKYPLFHPLQKRVRFHLNFHTSAFLCAVMLKKSKNVRQAMTPFA